MKEYGVEVFKLYVELDKCRSKFFGVKCKVCTKTFGEHQGMRCVFGKADSFVPDYRKKKIKEKKK